jgi:hypothetical protein
MKEQPMSDEKTMGQVIQIDEARIRDHLGEMVRGTVSPLAHPHSIAEDRPPPSLVVIGRRTH